MAVGKGRGIFSALGYPDFFWFWLSYFVSNAGSWMQSVTQGWLLFDLTGSPLYLGLFSLLRTIMLLIFFLLGGIAADRWSRRLVMIWIQIISLSSALVLAVLASSGIVQVWHIFVLGGITSTAWAFEQPVRQSLIPQLVSREDLVNALALNAVTWHGAGLLGPSLVGILVGWVGISGCFYINAVSYLAVIASLLWMHIPAQGGAGTTRGWTKSLAGGLAYVRQHELIVTLLVVSSLVSIFGRSYITLLPVIAKDVLRLDASGFGFISAAPGLGTIIGSVTLAALGRFKIKGRGLVAVLLSSAAALIVFASAGHFQTAFASLVMVGGLSTIFDTLLNTLIQLAVSDDYRGRVMGIYGMTAAGLRELGGLQAGLIAEWTNAPLAIGTGASAVAAVALLFLAPRARRFS